MSERDNCLLLEDIAEAINKVFKYTQGMNYDAFYCDDKTKDAVYRNFEIIGEAANQISKEFKSKYAMVGWSNLTGLRNRIIHGYFGVDPAIVWHIIQNNLKELKDTVNKMIKAEKTT